MAMSSVERQFYDEKYKQGEYAPAQSDEESGHREHLAAFVTAYGLQNKRCLEVGAGRGGLQNVVQNYIGLDIATSAKEYFSKPFLAGSASELPFEDNSFNGIWSIWVYEHVPDLEQALSELRRVIKPGGFLYLAPAWRCRSWYADGIPVRPYADLSLKNKLIKGSLPLRNSRMAQAVTLLPQRLSRRATYQASGKKPLSLRVKRLTPNYTTYWMPDSDAVNGIDPHEFILWFTSRGDICLSHPGFKDQLMGEKEGVVFQVRK